MRKKYQTEEERKEAARAAKQRYQQKKKNLSSLSPQPLSPSLNEPVLVSPVVGDEPAQKSVSRNEKQYQKLLDDYLGPVSGMLILALCLFVYRFPLETSEKLADILAMNQDELELIIPPLAGFLDKQQFSPQLRQRILQSGDLIGLVLGFGSYGARVYGALREIKGGIQREYRSPAGRQEAPANGLFSPALAGFGQFAAD